MEFSNGLDCTVFNTCLITYSLCACAAIVKYNIIYIECVAIALIYAMCHFMCFHWCKHTDELNQTEIHSTNSVQKLALVGFGFGLVVLLSSDFSSLEFFGSGLALIWLVFCICTQRYRRHIPGMSVFIRVGQFFFHIFWGHFGSFSSSLYLEFLVSQISLVGNLVQMYDWPHQICGEELTHANEASLLL